MLLIRESKDGVAGGPGRARLALPPQPPGPAILDTTEQGQQPDSETGPATEQIIRRRRRGQVAGDARDARAESEIYFESGRICPAACLVRVNSCHRDGPRPAGMIRR